MKVREKRRSTGSVVGLDLSLRAAAACALPVGWDHDMAKARTATFGSKLGLDATELERLERMCQIAHDVVVFCLNAKATHVFVEAYAFAMRSTSSHQLAELGGIVKSALFEHTNVVAETVVASRARKVLLQRLPRADLKKFVMRNVRRLGGPVDDWTEDEIDAFVVCNAGLEIAGGTAMSFEGE